MQESGPKTLHNVENPDMISQLIEECGYFVNARNETGDTPLHVMSTVLTFFEMLKMTIKPKLKDY